MSLTQLDPVAALVVIDMQKGIMGMQTVHPSGEVAQRIAQLARAFRKRDLPVVLVNVAGRAPGRIDAQFNFAFAPDWTDLIPELEQTSSDYAVTKMQVGAFYGTALERILRRAGVTQVFVTGIATSAGVEATARAAYDYGYNVVLVTDAMTDRDADAHNHSVETIFPRIGETTTTNEALTWLP
jgi:nicotinamidase-related amidase